jgi:glucuronide carrier protein
MWALEADTVEYGEWKTGVRTEGTTYALFSFTRKLGQAFGGAAAAFTLGLGGYISANAGHQTENAQWAIRAACGLVPAALFLLAISVMFFYPLTEKKFREMVGEVAARRAERELKIQASPSPPELRSGKTGAKLPSNRPYETRSSRRPVLHPSRFLQDSRGVCRIL